MAMERPVIATFWSGTTENMTEENSYPLKSDGLIEIEEGAFKGHKWLILLDKYSPEIIGEIVLGHITRILEHRKNCSCYRVIVS
ncbi:hypothetical protein F441_17804 [Phytophthora nicotianae CJ01A1]|nr:hypothetical protein L916_17349 [Phytophthora nicotianae]ETL82704.1 hypothetical protein L917_17180 [Phytophthora nicotianae]ETP05624.1 hypothetical protein F441_17804 [Phytophthora nicotianae CJ01A1]